MKESVFKQPKRKRSGQMCVAWLKKDIYEKY